MCAAVAMLALGTSPANANSPAGTSRRSSLAQAIVRLSLEYHYPAVKIDTDFSRRVISRYIDTLDPGHFYFTQQDTKAIHSAFDGQMARDLRIGNLKPAFAIHKFFLQREKQLFTLALHLLAHKPNLGSSGRYRVDRKNVPRPRDNAALELLWEKRIDNEILDRLLRGEPLKQVLTILRTRYRNPDPGSNGQVFRQYMNAFMAVMDPHSRYIDLQKTGGRIGHADNPHGIAGAMLVNRNGYVTIARLPVTGNTAAPGWLMNGDRILGIRMKPRGGTVPLSGWNLDRAIHIIRQSAGTGARLLVQPPGPDGLQRTKWVRVPTRTTPSRTQRAVAYIRFAREGTTQYKIGVIRIPSFYKGVKSTAAAHGSAGVASDVAFLIRLLKRKGVSAILLDMRSNPGGSLREALAMSGLFMPVDEPTVKILTRFGTNRYSTVNGNGGIVWWGPLGVLVNRGSASATEIFCGALKDYRRAVILGTRTWGKGTIQTFIPLAGHTRAHDPGELKLTTAEFFMPDGESPQIRGILPDIALPSASDAFIGGESAYSDALPASSTSPLHYKPLDGNDNALLPQVENYFQKKLAKGKALKLYEREISLLRQSDNASVSLDLRSRRHLLEASDARWIKLRADWSSVLGAPPPGNSGQSRRETFRIPDVPLHLAIRIMGKAVDLDPSIGLETSTPAQSAKRYRCWYQSWSNPLICTRNSQQIFQAPETLSAGKAGTAAPPLRPHGGL